MKNIKVSKIVYDKIKSEKKGGETFDDTLRRMLGIYPDLDDVMAYLSEELREWGKKIVNTINECGDFEMKIKEDHARFLNRDHDSVLFIDKEEGIAIASMHVTEADFYIQYRAKDGDMDLIGRVRDATDEERFEDIKEKTVSKVSGAVRKWGTSDP